MKVGVRESTQHNSALSRRQTYNQHNVPVAMNLTQRQLHLSNHRCQHLPTQISELDERLTKMQSAHNNNSPEPQLSAQTNRLRIRRKGTQYHQQEQQQQLTQQHERQLAQSRTNGTDQQNSQYGLYTIMLSAEQQALRAQ